MKRIERYHYLISCIGHISSLPRKFSSNRFWMNLCLVATGHPTGLKKEWRKDWKFGRPKTFFFLYSYEHQNQRKFSRIKFWSVKLWSVFHAILNFQYLFNCKFWEAELLDFNPLNIIFMKKFLWNYLYEPHDPIFSDSEENLLSTTVAFAFSVMQSS